MRKYINIYTVIPLLFCPLLQLIAWALSTGIIGQLIGGNIENVLELLGRGDFVLGGTYRFFIDGFAVMQMVLPLLSVTAACAFMRFFLFCQAACNKIFAVCDCGYPEKFGGRFGGNVFGFSDLCPDRYFDYGI